MDQQLLGVALQRDHKAIVVETRPGVRIMFPGGQAFIRNERDMIHLLRRDDLIIMVDEWVDFVPGWMNACGWDRPPKATIQLPEGYSLVKKGDEWSLQTVQPKRGPGRPKKKQTEPEPDAQSVDTLLDDLVPA